MTGVLALGSAGAGAGPCRAAAGAAVRHVCRRCGATHPVPDPPAIFAIGMNYRAHVAEMGREPPEWQYWFNKQRTAIAGPGDPIVLPAVSDMVDYEGELAHRHRPSLPACAGAPGLRGRGRVHRHQRRQRARLAVAHAHLHHGQVLRHARALRPRAGRRATSSAIPGSLTIRTWVNDELRQDSTTADLIFGCAEMIEYLTTAFPLEPGTIIATGTPAGVGAGFDPPRFLADGDTVRIAIEGVGELSNPVVQGGSTGARRDRVRLRSSALCLCPAAGVRRGSP